LSRPPRTSKRPTIASDCGLPDLARSLCHRQADVYLHARPLNAQAARYALEPLVRVLSTRLAPPVAVALPVYLVYQKTRLPDTIWGVALMHVVMVIDMVTWILIETFNGLPAALTEDALVDGCGQWTAFRRIMVRLAAPGPVGAGVLSFLLSWNEFFFALILTSGHTTAPVGLFNFVGFQSVNLGALAAAATILLIPAFVVVLGFQKFLFRGLTMGAVKG
jgi:multiple sugar transport system permease protein